MVYLSYGVLFCFPFMLLIYMLYFLYFSTSYLFIVYYFLLYILSSFTSRFSQIRSHLFLVYSPYLIPFPIFSSCRTYLVADPHSLFPEVTCDPFWECLKHGEFQKGKLVKHGISDFRFNVAGAFVGCVYKKYYLPFCLPPSPFLFPLSLITTAYILYAYVILI